MSSAMKYYRQLLPLLRSKSAWKTALWITAAFFLLTIIFYAAERYRGRKNYPDTRIQMSVYNSGSSGTMALREFFEKTGLKTGKILRPLVKFQDSVSRKPAGVPGSVIIIDPGRDLTDGDITALRRLAEQGAAIFIFARQESLFRLLFSYNGEWKKTAPSAGKALTPARGTKTSSLRFSTAGMEDVRGLDLPDKWRFRKVPKHWQSLVHDAEGTFALHRSAGKGHFVTVSGALFLSNADIRKRDNGIFARNIVRRFHKKGALYFDEYHHGFSTRYTLLYFVAKSEYFNILFQTVFFFLLCAIPAAIRFGQYRKRPAAVHEKIYYFSEGMAGLLRKRRYYGGVLDMMIDNYRKINTLKPEPRFGEKMKKLEAVRKMLTGKKAGKTDIRRAYTIIKGEQEQWHK